MADFKDLKNAYLMSKNEDRKINQEWEYVTLESFNLNTDINLDMLDFEKELKELKSDLEYNLIGIKNLIAIKVKEKINERYTDKEARRNMF